MVFPSLEAASDLEKEGLSVGVVNCRFAKPLDRKLVEYGRAAGKVLVVEENALQGGLGGAILELFSDLGATDLFVRRMGLPDALWSTVPSCSQGEIRAGQSRDHEGSASLLPDATLPASAWLWDKESVINRSPFAEVQCSAEVLEGYSAPSCK
jgi:1-deoxy-D-xylulose-5-phosphate synthase